MKFGPNSAHKAPNIDLGSLLPYAKPTIKNLGKIMNSDFKLDEKASVCVLGILKRETAAIFRDTGFIGLHSARAAEARPITNCSTVCVKAREN